MFVAEMLKKMRDDLDLSQKGFADRFRIPIGSLRNWEQGRVQPDAAATTLLLLIADDPDEIANRLKRITSDNKDI